MNIMEVELEKSWKDVLKEEFQKDYMKELQAFLVGEKKKGQLIYPSSPNIFNAFNYTPFDKVKVVIIGQDPYHGPNQAHGLSFSVQNGIKTPPSLLNIYKELQNDIPGFVIPQHGDLTNWAKQGVLLLNATLTVEAGKAGSHKKKGWERFTDEVIKKLSERRKGIIFLLWGKFAQSKAVLIDHSKHYFLVAPHPSPLARGFKGCQHFSKTNALLRKIGLQEINWQN